ncbi:MAG TPA: hypothetical protein VJT49_03570 [Amycolatopsis sp.]|uniref:hypothetical protein n=1 Tax=Amycolatopsis sp. TaxID=37632 RepID=UPI002B469B4E|nr:hypothetical protein [Amycolatopsis sp.]HKS44193.1 hypothetical protein [Amycolatopsis sp.]
MVDATSLTGYENRFDILLDSGLYHCLSADDRPAYVSALARAARSGRLKYLFPDTRFDARTQGRSPVR